MLLQRIAVFALVVLCLVSCGARAEISADRLAQIESAADLYADDPARMKAAYEESIKRLCVLDYTVSEIGKKLKESFAKAGGNEEGILYGAAGSLEDREGLLLSLTEYTKEETAAFFARTADNLFRAGYALPDLLNVLEQIAKEYAFVLPSGWKDKYQIGDSGDDLMDIKILMQNLGYFAANAAVSNRYNTTMAERVALFQKKNGLDATGIINRGFLKILLSGSANPASDSASAAAPAADYDGESILVSSGTAEWGMSFGYPWFKWDVENTSDTQTIDGLTLVYYCLDAEGVILQAYGMPRQFWPIAAAVSPLKKVTLPRITVYGYTGVRQVFVAVYQYHCTDGETVSIPEEDWEFLEITY